MTTTLYDSIGYRLLRRVFPTSTTLEVSTAYARRSKLEVLFGPEIWDAVAGRTVLDFGCGAGEQVIELAEHGAAHVIGLDKNPHLLRRAQEAVNAHGLSGRCTLTQSAPPTADLVLSLDCFEHFDNPAAILETMAGLLAPKGEAWISFGPTWYHPLGGHLFSVFPWSHLLFSEAALLRWRADFKPDKPRTFAEAGLNKMTVRRFRHLVAESAFDPISFEAVPIRRLRWAALPVTREFTTAFVRCRLRRKTQAA